jgi:large subunit ribosomal protein L32
VAVPKKRTSVSRKGLRRAGQHHKLFRKFPMSCSNCGDYAMPHHVCPSCGFYKGKQVIEVKQKTETEENAEA